MNSSKGRHCPLRAVSRDADGEETMGMTRTAKCRVRSWRVSWPRLAAHVAQRHAAQFPRPDTKSRSLGAGDDKGGKKGSRKPRKGRTN